MAYIEGIQISIPVGRKQATSIISAMRRVLQQRHYYQIGRKQFLRKWDKLRTALLLTKDYQELRQRTLARNGGKCEHCGVRVAEHVHHIERVAIRPELALVDSNVEAVCRACHKAAHS